MITNRRSWPKPTDGSGGTRPMPPDPLRSHHRFLFRATALQLAARYVAGGDQAHENMQPYLVMNYIIALEGFHPARN